MEVHRAELCAFPLRAYVDATRDAIGSSALEQMLAPYGIRARDLEDPNAWYSLEFVEAFLRDMVAHCGMDHLDRATLLGMTPKYAGALLPLFVAFGSPLFAFQQESRAAARFNKTGVWDLEEGRPGFARVAFRGHTSVTVEKGPCICRIRRVQQGFIPALFGRPAGTVEHPKCMLRGDPACVYEVTWDEPPLRRDARVGLWSGLVAGVVFALATSQQIWPAALLTAAFSICGWAIGRLRIVRAELGARTREITEHNQALSKMTRANEERFEELVQAKAEVDRKVDERTAELRETSAKLADTLARVQSLDRAKTDFFNNVSHELRSPLTMILAPLEEMAAGRIPPGGEGPAIQAMHRNASRLLRLINQLLDLAKVDAGEMRINPVMTDLSALVQGLVDSFQPAAAKKGTRLELRTTPSLAPLRVDPAWIESAITNLVANAMRLTPAGKAVRVSLRDDGTDVSIAVADEGPGIAPADREKIFERFAQGDSTARVVGGTGIGLALVREAARLHDGEVKLQSELGKGAIFTLSVPRRPESAPDAGAGSAAPRTWKPSPILVEEQRSDSETSTLSGPGTNAALAFVIEDNPELRDFVAAVLAASYRVQTFGDGREAVRMARELKPDVVVSDVAMPEMNGFEVCRALRKHQSTESIPIVLVTARTDLSSILAGFDSGASDYVLKPFHGRELLARVDVHVRLRRMVQELALRERHAMLGVLAASVAHQVRNPLTTLVSGLPAMRAKLQGNLSPSTLDMFELMMDCAARIDRLTCDLMDLSRVDRDASGSFRPSDGLRAAIRLVQSRLSPRVSIEEQVEDSPVMEGKAGDLNHVFMNILDNAARAVAVGGRVRIEGGAEDSAYIVRIGDSGPGISEEDAPKVFQPFYTTRNPGEGTGLGLAIALQVMRQCGGAISLGRSELGGAEFRVEIPLLQPSTPIPAEIVAPN
jgi:signal transduction histidine kinase